MNNLAFSTHIQISDQDAVKFKKLGQLTEGYFYFGSKRAKVLDNVSAYPKIHVMEYYPTMSTHSKVIQGTAKVLTWSTGVVPLAMVVGKWIFRSANQFVKVKPSKERVLEGIKNNLKNMDSKELNHHLGTGGGNAIGTFTDEDGRHWSLTSNSHIAADWSIIELGTVNGYLLKQKRTAKGQRSIDEAGEYGIIQLTGAELAEIMQLIREKNTSSDYQAL